MIYLLIERKFSYENPFASSKIIGRNIKPNQTYIEYA